MIKKIFPIIVFFLLLGCENSFKNTQPKTVEVDFSKKPVSKEILNHDSILTLKVAVASMISPKEAFKHYEELIKYISGKIGIPIEFKQRKTYKEVNTMLERNEVNFAFICSGAYTKEAEKSTIEILVVPVSNGKPLYQAYVISRKNSGINKFKNLRGKSFAFTDPLSNTGYLYAANKVYKLGYSIDKYFSKSFFTYAHDNSIQLVAKGTVDGATVDGLVFDYMSKFFPDRVKDIQIIEKSEYYGIPPIVVPVGLDKNIKNKLRNIFFNMGKDPAGKEILDKLLIDKFILGSDSIYNSIRHTQRSLRK